MLLRLLFGRTRSSKDPQPRQGCQCNIPPVSLKLFHQLHQSTIRSYSEWGLWSCSISFLQVVAKLGFDVFVFVMILMLLPRFCQNYCVSILLNFWFSPRLPAAIETSSHGGMTKTQTDDTIAKLSLQLLAMSKEVFCTAGVRTFKPARLEHQ